MSLGEIRFQGFLLLLLLLPGPAQATSLRSVSVEEMLEKSALIVEAEVVAVETVVEDSPRAIYTCASLQVLDVIKGDAEESPVELCFSGGTSGGVTHKVFGMVYPEVGETGIYFVLALDQPLVNPFYGWHQGHFRIEFSAERPQGVVTTVQGRQVVDLAADSPDGRPGPGAARGVVLRSEASPETGPGRPRTDENAMESNAQAGPPPLAPEEFKARLRSLLGGLGE